MGHYAAEMNYRDPSERLRDEMDRTDRIHERFLKNSFKPSLGMIVFEIEGSEVFYSEFSMMYGLVGKPLPVLQVQRIKKEEDGTILVSFLTEKRAKKDMLEREKARKKNPNGIFWYSVFYPFTKEWYDARWFQKRDKRTLPRRTISRKKRTQKTLHKL